MEREERESKKNYKTLVRALIHDLRNPLTGIRGFAELLENELQDSPKLSGYAREILRGADDLEALLEKETKGHS